jgi:DNA-binding transcriptional LysR family regulator
MIGTGVGGQSPVDDALAPRGERRRVALRLATFLVAPQVVASSDLIATHPLRLARRALQTLPLVERPPPLRVPGFEIHAGFHERRRSDPAHQWLRETVAAVAHQAA